ncbi:MAG: LytTR family DNA-binding domain-containing protein [Oscillospiraceae bacterium]|nr:LytTR family DNA-binding domain-containing protein [Oscillospiraceae bacterium]
MTYKIAVCDDEQIFVDDVVKKLKEQSEQCEIYEYISGEELLNSSLEFDMIFLDIEMTGINGINAAFVLRERGFDGMIIFLTSHTEFMPDAFKVKAFRFLDKPLESEKFNEAFSEAKKEIMNTEHILLSDRSGKTVYLKLTDIVYLEAYGDGTYIYGKTGKVYDTDKPLKYWKGQIGSEHFYQIHKSFIVSYLYVSDISKDGQVAMKGFKQPLDISRRNVVPFRNGFFDYIRKYARIM